ncbi:MAG: sigma-70 family RNA polymerase sigma factor [Bryobacterales bacterium]|nr:sigma-70 family RNA polymerase sigma factor [Bryobacterales bacterium]
MENHFSTNSASTSFSAFIIDKHLTLIRTIALHIRQRLPRHVELDDLIQAGALGLLDACAKYKPEKNVPFVLYAKFRIRGAILDSLRQLDALSRDARRKQKLQTMAREQARAGSDEDPSSTPLPYPPVGYPAARADSQTTSHADPADRAVDPEAPPDFSPESICQRQQLRGVLMDARALLPPRYQQLIALYYDAGLTMKQIASAMGVNESRISQMHQVALQRMASSMQHNGIEGRHLMHMR